MGVKSSLEDQIYKQDRRIMNFRIFIEGLPVLVRKSRQTPPPPPPDECKWWNIK